MKTINLTVDNEATITFSKDIKEAVSKDIISPLMRKLTLNNPEYDQAEKQGRYTGNIERFINCYKLGKQKMIIPRGYTKNCKDFIKNCGYQVNIYDKRRILDPLDIEFNGKLWDFQKQALNYITKRDFGHIQSPTGSGKTVLALAAIAYRKQPTLILVHSKELLYQWNEALQMFLDTEPGLIGDGKFSIKPITVAIVNSANKNLQTLPAYFGHVVVDECHRVPSTMFTDTVRAFDSIYLLGLSATAFRNDKLDDLIHFTLGERIYHISRNVLYKKGIITRPMIKYRQTGFTYYYEDDWQEMITHLTHDNLRNNQIAQDVVNHTQDGTALVVSDRIDHIENLEGLINRPGLTTKILTGNTAKKERKAIVEQVKNGQVDVLFATCQLIGEGFDCPQLTSLFLTTPIRFEGKIIQAVGRVLRPSPGKKPVVVDYVDQNVGVLKAQAKARAKTLEKLKG